MPSVSNLRYPQQRMDVKVDNTGIIYSSRFYQVGVMCRVRHFSVKSKRVMLIDAFSTQKISIMKQNPIFIKSEVIKSQCMHWLWVNLEVRALSSRNTYFWMLIDWYITVVSRSEYHLLSPEHTICKYKLVASNRQVCEQMHKYKALQIWNEFS